MEMDYKKQCFTMVKHQLIHLIHLIHLFLKSKYRINK
jgi:hypothetical protein